MTVGSSKQPTDLTIRPFAPQDQKPARGLILEGLRGRFGTAFDDELNRDLDDIAASYAEAYFVVALLRGRLVGTGCLVPRGPEVAQVVRMSVGARHRRRGIGAAILDRLLDHARYLGCRRVILRTNAAWDGAIAFYTSCGFRQIGRNQGGILFEMIL